MAGKYIFWKEGTKMKKMMLLLVLVSVLLTGCCLRHDWEEATCETPRTCSKCAETEGEALGHDWVDATCEEPETCSRCGTTQGQALGHVTAKWKEVSDSVMSTICEVCDAEVEQEMDREILGMQDILGKWRLIAVQPGGLDGDWEMLRDPSVYVEFFESGEMSYKIGDYDTGEYEFDYYNDEVGAYWFYCEFDDGYCQFRMDEDGELYWVADAIWMCFEK